MTTGEKITLLRKENNYTQEQLAQILDVSRQSVSKWELDQTFPETKVLIQMSTIFHCTVDYLLKEEVDDKNSTIAKEKPNASSLFIQSMTRSITFEYKSKKKIFGKPLVHINFGLGKVADGFIAIGFVAKGIISVGLLSLGIISFGVLSLGLIALGSFALGLIALGAITVGILSLGAIAIGIIAYGGVAIGEVSIGGLAIGKYIAYGDNAKALIAIGDSVSNGKQFSFYKNAITIEEFDNATSNVVPSYFKWLIPFIRNLL